MLKETFRRISRRKHYFVDGDDLIENHTIASGPKLLRILSLFDLTFLGVGSTLGVGIYVLAGSVAKDIAGPAVCLSFLIAAFASGLSAFCYAEFGARVPKAGSAYIYSYVTVGEIIAFIIGWNLILEYLIGTSSVARALSSNVDSIFNHRMSHFFKLHFPIYTPNFSDFADWFSMAICLIMTVVLAIGVRSSSYFTNIFTVLNLVVVLFVIIAGATHANFANWNLPAMNLKSVQTSAGFMPFGFSGVVAGAAKCFFGFVGFDSIAAAGEEAKNAKRNIPLSIMLTLLVVLLAYIGVSTILTLMIPYYLQDKEIPLVHAFQQVGQSWAAWIVLGGSTFGLTASLVGSLMPIPRIVMAMAKDGLLFRCLANVHPRFKTPFTATCLTGLIAAIAAMVTDLDSLVDMMSIGTLLAYTLVAVSILILRYEFNDMNGSNSIVKKCGVFPWQKEPTPTSSKKSKIAITIFSCLTIVVCWLTNSIQQSPVQHFGLTIFFISASILMILSVLYLVWLPRSINNVYFMVPMVPLLPALSIWINVYLMFQLSYFTWMRFLVWMILGLLTYGCYGIRNSTMENEYLESPCLALDDDLSPLVVNEEEM